ANGLLYNPWRDDYHGRRVDDVPLPLSRALWLVGSGAPDTAHGAGAAMGAVSRARGIRPTGEGAFSRRRAGFEGRWNQGGGRGRPRTRVREPQTCRCNGG